jgi:hypothetical protein
MARTGSEVAAASTGTREGASYLARPSPSRRGGRSTQLQPVSEPRDRFERLVHVMHAHERLVQELLERSPPTAHSASLPRRTCVRHLVRDRQPQRRQGNVFLQICESTDEPLRPSPNPH